MKHILPWLFLIFLNIPSSAYAVIEFHISNFQKVSDYYSVDAEITGAATGSSYYVQAMFTKPDPTGYFGFTWSQKGEWFKYVSSPDEEFIKSNFPILETGVVKTFLLKPDTGSSKYSGPGDYYLKLKRYTGESSSGTFSDTLTVSLTDSSASPEAASTPASTQTPTTTPTATPAQSSPTPTPTLTSTPTPPSSKSPSATKTPTSTKSLTQPPSPTLYIESSPSTLAGQVLAETAISTSPSPTISEPKTKQRLNSFYKNSFIVGVLVSSVAGTLLYFRLKNR